MKRSSANMTHLGVIRFCKRNLLNSFKECVFYWWKTGSWFTYRKMDNNVLKIIRNFFYNDAVQVYTHRHKCINYIMQKNMTKMYYVKKLRITLFFLPQKHNFQMTVISSRAIGLRSRKKKRNKA